MGIEASIGLHPFLQLCFALWVFWDNSWGWAGQVPWDHIEW